MGEIADEHIDRMMGFGWSRPRPTYPRPRPGFTVTADDFDVVPDEVAELEEKAPATLTELLEEVHLQLTEPPEPDSNEAYLFGLLELALPYLERLATIDVEDLV